MPREFTDTPLGRRPLPRNAPTTMAETPVPTANYGGGARNVARALPGAMGASGPPGSVKPTGVMSNTGTIGTAASPSMEKLRMRPASTGGSSGFKDMSKPMPGGTAAGPTDVPMARPLPPAPPPAMMPPSLPGNVRGAFGGFGQGQITQNPAGVYGAMGRGGQFQQLGQNALQRYQAMQPPAPAPAPAPMPMTPPPQPNAGQPLQMFGPGTQVPGQLPQMGGGMVGIEPPGFGQPFVPNQPPWMQGGPGMPMGAQPTPWGGPMGRMQGPPSYGGGIPGWHGGRAPIAWTGPNGSGVTPYQPGAGSPGGGMGGWGGWGSPGRVWPGAMGGGMPSGNMQIQPMPPWYGGYK